MALMAHTGGLSDPTWFHRVPAGEWGLPQATDTRVVAYFLHTGSAVARIDGEPHPLGRDDLLLVGSRDRVGLQVGAEARMTAFSLPSRPFDRQPRIRRDRSVLFSTAAPGMASILGHVFRAVSESPAMAHSPAAARLAQQLAELTAAQCVELSANTDAGDVFARCEALIESALWDADLCPAYIAERMHISLRTLHRSFRAHGTTVAGWVRARRLARFRDDLTDPALRGVSVRALGARWGLHDPAHLNRLFKDAYGVTPAAYRDAAGPAPA
jgi:AraC-like DNA-binding protein